MTVINGFLSIEDGLSQQRFGAVLGIPQYQGENDDYSIKASLHSQVVIYNSSVYFNSSVYRSVLEILFQQRRNPDSSSIAGVDILLNLLNTNDRALRYVCSLPPPSTHYT